MAMISVAEWAEEKGRQGLLDTLTKVITGEKEQGIKKIVHF